MEENNEIDQDKDETTPKKDPICPSFGLRSYDANCQICGTPIVDKDEEEEYDWREHKR